MSITIVLLCLLAAIIELDDVCIGQTGISRPLVAGIIFGLLTGDPYTGAQIGIFTSLVFLDHMPIGGVLPPNGLVSVFCAVIFAAGGMPVYFAFFLGVLAGLLFRRVEMFHRNYMGRVMLSSVSKIKDNPQKVLNYFMLIGLALQFITAFAYLFVFIGAVKLIYPCLPLNSESVHMAFALAYFAAPWMGIMALARKFVFSRPERQV